MRERGYQLQGGGTGFIGCHLIKVLKANGLKSIIVSRSPGRNRITWSELKRQGLPEDVTAVVSLSGENLMDPRKRFTLEYQEALRFSRINTTETLTKLIAAAKNPPKVYVSSSAVGFYKPSPTAMYTEDSPGGDFDFLSRLTTDWEQASKLPASSTVRQVVVRIGVALGRDGGVIQSMFYPFFLGLGGKLGSGEQWFPWIHVNDVAGIYMHAIVNDQVTGILNAVAPEAATNMQFTKAFGRAMRRPTIFPVPAFVIKKIYGHERATVVLEGQRVFPKRTIESGYKYMYPDLAGACKEFSKLIYTVNM